MQELRQVSSNELLLKCLQAASRDDSTATASTVLPRYMRPPLSALSSLCLAVLDIPINAHRARGCALIGSMGRRTKDKAKGQKTEDSPFRVKNVSRKKKSRKKVC